MKKMNLPNKLTLLRIILVPVFIVFFMASELGCTCFGANSKFILRMISAIIFGIAAITDTLDGNIARKYNIITNFGKLMDPLADKILVCSAFILLTWTREVPVWVTLIIIIREFAISSIRLIAAEKGVVIAASNVGKSKTVTQMIGVISYLFLIYTWCEFLNILTVIIIYVATLLTIISIVDYAYKNREVFKE